MVFNATFNNITVTISWRSVLLMEETGENGENHRTLSHNVVSNTSRLRGTRTHNVGGDRY
jgi:hypothetical protein